MSAPIAPEVVPAAVADERPAAVLVDGQPAPVSAPELATVRDTPSTNALSDAFANLTATLGASLKPAESTPEPVTPVEEAPKTEQPRDPVTQPFVPKDEAPAAPAAPAAAPAAGDAPAEGDDDTFDPALLVDLLPRHASDTALQIAVDTPELAERLRQTLNGAMRREQYESAMQEVNAQRQQIEQQEIALMVDPVSVLSDTLTPEQADSLLLVMLSDDQRFARLSGRIEKMFDPLGLREVRLDARDEYTKARDNASQVVHNNRQVQQNVRQLSTAIEALAPEHMKPEQRQLWVLDAKRELAHICRTNDVQLLDPMQVPTVLRARLAASGIETTAAVETVARAVYGRRSSRTAEPRAAASSALPAAPAAATPTPGSRPVATLQAAQQRRAAAAAVGGAGTGTPTAGGLPEMPAGAGLDEAFSLVKGRVAAKR